MKYLSYIFSALIYPLILKASTVYAQNAGKLEGIYKNCPGVKGDPQKGDLACVIQDVIGMVGTLIGAILVVVIVIAGLMYITSMGNPERVGLAKKTLVGAIIGLIIVVLSGLMVGLVFTLFK